MRLPPRSCDWAAPLRRECPNRCHPFGLSRALSCARRSRTFGAAHAFCQGEASAAAGSPDATRVESLARHSSARAGPAPRGSPGSPSAPDRLARRSVVPDSRLGSHRESLQRRWPLPGKTRGQHQKCATDERRTVLSINQRGGIDLDTLDAVALPSHNSLGAASLTAALAQSDLSASRATARPYKWAPAGEHPAQ